MMPFDSVFHDVANKETRTLQVTSAANVPGLPVGDYMLRELYCNEPRCDCRRVLLHVHWDDLRGPVVASINYAFDPPAEDDWMAQEEGQIFLDPMNPQSRLSEPLFDVVWRMIGNDLEYQERLERHYAAFKEVVDDAGQPKYHIVRIEAHADPDFEPAFPAKRSLRKVGRNAKCPCGSGKKHKHCCGRGR